jgi:16S rRNA processing protein RimM
LTGADEEPDRDRPLAGAGASLVAGRVGRPHGLDGSFYVTRPRPRLLTVDTLLALGGQTARIVRRAGTDARPIVRVEGVEDRAAAEQLRGVELRVDSAEAPSLGEGEWWAHELEGCIVYDGERPLGTVTAMIELPSCEALEVDVPGRRDALLVPMVKDAIRAVVPAQRRIEVDVTFLGLDDDHAGDNR